MGEDTLAKWLLFPSPVEQIRWRHAAVDDLRDQLDLREDLAVLGEDVGVGVNPEALLKWAESPNQMKPLRLQWLAPALAAMAVFGDCRGRFGERERCLYIVVVIEAFFTYRLEATLEEVLHGTEHAFRDLDLLSGVLARVEAHTFHAPRLQALQRELMSSGVPASKAIAQPSERWSIWINSRHNTAVEFSMLPSCIRCK